MHKLTFPCRCIAPGKDVIETKEGSAQLSVVSTADDCHQLLYICLFHQLCIRWGTRELVNMPVLATAGFITVIDRTTLPASHRRPSIKTLSTPVLCQYQISHYLLCLLLALRHLWYLLLQAEPKATDRAISSVVLVDQ